jgi:hypothetical protein
MPLEGTTVLKATIVSVLVMAACATGGGPEQGVLADASVRRDATTTVTADALRGDAGVGQDAQLSQIVDAGGGSGGLFCQANNQCTVGGECCVTLGGPNGFCAPGDVVLGQCVPQ